MINVDTYFKVGDFVRKKCGYMFPGIVRAVFQNGDGEWRVVVECTEPTVKGILHIYNQGQLESLKSDRVRPEVELIARALAKTFYQGVRGLNKEDLVERDVEHNWRNFTKQADELEQKLDL